MKNTSTDRKEKKYIRFLRDLDKCGRMSLAELVTRGERLKKKHGMTEEDVFKAFALVRSRSDRHYWCDDQFHKGEQKMKKIDRADRADVDDAVTKSSKRVDINALPHTLFDDTMRRKGYRDDNPPPDNVAVISICCCDEIKKNYLEAVKHETDEHWFKEDHRNVLNVEFDDIHQSEQATEFGTARGITAETARRIVAFVKDNVDADEWFIHCRAGRSRSVATAHVVGDIVAKSGRRTKINTTNGVMGINVFVREELLKAVENDNRTTSARS